MSLLLILLLVISGRSHFLKRPTAPHTHKPLQPKMHAYQPPDTATPTVPTTISMHTKHTKQPRSSLTPTATCTHTNHINRHMHSHQPHQPPSTRTPTTLTYCTNHHTHAYKHRQLLHLCTHTVTFVHKKRTNTHAQTAQNVKQSHRPHGSICTRGG